MRDKQNTGGRPCGEIRDVVLNTFTELAGSGAAPTWRDVARVACVGFKVARNTTKNLVRAQQLVPMADVTVPGARRPMKAYRPAARQATGWVAGGSSIDHVMRSWTTS